MSTSPPPGSGLGRTLACLLAVLLLPAVAGGVLFWQHDRHEDAVAAREEDRAAVRAATQEVRTWATVDHRKLDEYFAAVEAGATGQFLGEFKQTEDVLRKGLVENESVQVPTIPKGGAGLLERQDDVARVVVALDAVVTNKSVQGPQPRQYRMQVTLRKVKGAWLTSNLEFVG
jgi:hypothetical protein